MKHSMTAHPARGRRMGRIVRTAAVGAGMALLGALAVIPARSWAGAYGAVRVTVRNAHDKPMAGATVTLKSSASGRLFSGRTNAHGHIDFPTVSIGSYRLTVRRQGFLTRTQAVTVQSGYFPAPIVHLLRTSGLARITISASRQPAVVASVTPITLVSQQDILATPGAINANSLAMITDYVPGAYEAHDMLHIRGGHQTSWLIDGVEIPNTNIAEDLGPEVQPQDIQTLGAEGGGYNADEGDRTYGIFNVIPKTGFGSTDLAQLGVSAGNFAQTDDYLSVASHRSNFAYYASVEGNRSNLGLQTPQSAVVHDATDGFGLFTNLQYNPGESNDFRLVAQLRQDAYQIPDCTRALPDDPQCLGQSGDVQHEADDFALLSWVHTFPDNMVLTSSLMYHFERAAYDGGASDHPTVTYFHHSSQYEGGEENLRMHFTHNHVDVGVYGFGQQDHADFNLLFTDGRAPLTELQSPSGGLIDAWVQDTYDVSHWLHLSAGVRQSHFAGLITENATDPRYGATLRLPKLDWVLTAFWGKYYQAPPLESLAGPLASYANSQNSQFLPLHGERDKERQFGVTLPLAGWTVGVDYFVTESHNFFDHNPIGESNIYLPVTDQGALIKGTEVTVRSPGTWRYGHVHLAYSNQTAQCFGSVNGGLVVAGTACGDYIALDHDQRNTLNVGYNVDLPLGFYVGSNLSVNSGLSNGFAAPPGYQPSHLPSYAILDLTVGRNFSRDLQVSLTGLNITNRHLLTDNSLTFGGVHWNNPFQIYLSLHYRFHY